MTAIFEALLELFIAVVARFVGVAVVAAITTAASGFRRSYRSEWRRLFAKYPGTYEWIDLFGVLVLAAVIGGVVCAVFLSR